MDVLIIFGIFLALVMNFFNGLNDASHSIATVVVTKALSPWGASVSSAIANFVGPFIFTTAVAATIGTSIVVGGALTTVSIIIAMISAITLVFFATRIGFPLSSSQALIGGLIGAGVAAYGPGALILPSGAMLESLGFFCLVGAVIGAITLAVLAYWIKENVVSAIVLGLVFGIAFAVPVLMLTGTLVLTGILAIVVFIFISPIIGFEVAFLFDLLVTHAFRFSRQDRMKHVFQPLQVLASLFQAAGHGANDGQHAVGVITALLVAGGVISSFIVPLWVVIVSSVAIGLGTLFGGWKVINKLAREITKIRPYQGFCAATSGGAIIALVTTRGVPVSSTQVMSGAIIGVGATRGVKAVKWEVTRDMMEAWVFTIPIAFTVAWCGYMIVALVFHLPL